MPQAFATEEAQTETLNYVHRYFSVKSWKFRKENKGMVGGDTNSRSEYYVVVISRNLNFDAYKFIYCCKHVVTITSCEYHNYSWRAGHD